MATADSTNKDSEATITDVLSQTRVIQAVLARLDARARLDALARELYEGLVPSPPQIERAMDRTKAILGWMQGETDRSTICSNKGTDPNTNFQCASGQFDCTKFVCQSNAVFNGCGAGNDPTQFGCNQAAAGFGCKDKFDCKTDGFDCAVFACSTKAGTGSYTCDEKYDFMCNWTLFNCFDSFNCTAGHVFMCGSSHNCADSFGCASTGVPKCVSDYSRDGTDGVAGDFACGNAGPSNDAFECQNTFQCTSADQFECTLTTGFTCGTGDGTDSFTCGAMTKFSCTQPGGFDCNTPEGKFNCANQQSKYTPPPPT